MKRPLCSMLCALALCSLTGRLLAQAAADTRGPAGQSPAETKFPTLSESLRGLAKADYESGRILFGDGDFAGAIVKFQRALERDRDPRLLWDIAVCEKNLRHYATVLGLLKRYQHEGAGYMSAAHRAEVADVLETVRVLISTVHLTVQPDGAHVFVDDAPRGTTPLAAPLLVDLGARRIRVSKPGYKDQIISQTLAGASELTLSVTLRPDVHQGRLAISGAADEDISVDGRWLARGYWQGALPSGEHTVRVSALGKRPYTSQLVIEDDRTRSLFVELESNKTALPTVLWVGASVLVAGGLATGAYFLLRPASVAPYQAGSWEPGLVRLP
jgi:hypothetical protein